MASSSRCLCLRWFFPVCAWEPSSSADWLKAAGAIQSEEWQRCGQFVFANDVKRALIGRLLLRQAAKKLLPNDISWSKIRFKRTEKGKPVLDQKVDFSLNISHHGAYVCLAASCSDSCGVDVMEIERPRKQTATSFLNLMSKQFSAEENRRLNCLKADSEKLILFYRYWCLKESYIKALGVGLYNELSQLDFRVQVPWLKQNELETDTNLIVHGVKQTDWLFEECLLDATHCVAVCTKVSTTPATCRTVLKEFQSFREINFEELIENSEPLHELNEMDIWEQYINKKPKAE